MCVRVANAYAYARVTIKTQSTKAHAKASLLLLVRCWVKQKSMLMNYLEIIHPMKLGESDSKRRREEQGCEERQTVSNL